MFTVTRAPWIVTALIASTLVAAMACGDGDDGIDDEAADDATSLTSQLEDFKRNLSGVANVEEASDDVKGDLKDGCSDLQDGVDSDDLDDFCGDLGDAIDGENQTDFAGVKGRFGDVEAQVRAEIADRLQEAAGVDEDDGRPGEGGGVAGTPGTGDDND